MIAEDEAGKGGTVLNAVCEFLAKKSIIKMNSPPYSLELWFFFLLFKKRVKQSTKDLLTFLKWLRNDYTTERYSGNKFQDGKIVLWNV